MRLSDFPIRIIEGFQPSEHELLEMCCSLATEEMISFIAAAHYGYQAEYNVEVLNHIIASRKFPQELETGVHEVLQLTRWSDPGNRDQHLARLLCCTYLLNLTEDTTYDEFAEEASLATLVESVLVLGPEFYKPALRFVAWKILFLYKRELAWLAEEDDEDDEIGIDGYHVFALLLLAILNNAQAQDISSIFNLLDDEMYLEESSKKQVIERLTAESATREITWKTIIHEIFSAIDFIRDERLKSELAEIANTFH